MFWAATGLEQGVAWGQIGRQCANLGPLRPIALRECIQLHRLHFKRLHITAFGKNFHHFEVDGWACRVNFQGFFQDFFCLQVASVGKIDIGLGHRIHIAACIQLAGRVHHGVACGQHFGGVDALASAGSEERVGLQPAFEERAVNSGGFLALPPAVHTESGQECNQAASGRQCQRVVQQSIHKAGFFSCNRGGCGGNGHRCWRGSGWRLGCFGTGFVGWFVDRFGFFSGCGSAGGRRCSRIAGWC